MIGGPIGGMISDKILKSPSKYLCYTFIISTAALVLLIMLPHESMPVYLGMACTLGFGAIVFTQRAVFFAPIGEAKIAENKTGAAMALGSFIGYAPAMFCFSLYGYILDLNPGIIGYKIVFGIMACFAFSGAVVLNPANENRINRRPDKAFTPHPAVSHQKKYFVPIRIWFCSRWYGSTLRSNQRNSK